MKVRVKRSKNQETEITGLSDESKIKELKKLIITEIDDVYVPEAIHLVYQGTYLANGEANLAKYHLQDNSLVGMVVDQAKNIKTYQPISVPAPNNIYQLVNQMIQGMPNSDTSVSSQFSFTHRVSPELHEEVTPQPPTTPLNPETTLPPEPEDTPITRPEPTVPTIDLTNGGILNNLSSTDPNSLVNSLTSILQQAGLETVVSYTPLTTDTTPTTSQADLTTSPTSPGSRQPVTDVLASQAPAETEGEGEPETEAITENSVNNETLNSDHSSDPEPGVMETEPTSSGSTLTSPEAASSPNNADTLQSITQQYLSSLQGLVNQLSETSDSATETRSANLASLESMGYTNRELNEMALDSSHGSISLAVDWLENLR